MNRHEFSVGREPVELAEVAPSAVARHEASAREFGVDARGRGRRVLGRGRPRPPAPGRLEPGRERAARDAAAAASVTVRVGAAPADRLGHRARASSSDDLPHAFDRFFLYDKYGRERPVGSGLGLAIVKQLTEAMGGGHGRVEPGAGATFVVTLHPFVACTFRRQGRSFEVSTTSKSAPVSRPRLWRSSFDQRGSGAPLMYQGEPLSARIIP